MFTNKEYVYEVYKQKSFSKAAESLYISQPSLSATIKKVESRVGAQIFDRSTNPVQLTDCGREYIKSVEKIIDIENSFTNYLGNLNELKAGNLSIGASNFFASYILPPIITRFKTRYPKVTIHLIEADTAHLERQLFAGGLDLMVENYDFNETVYKKDFFYSEQLILAVPQAFRFNRTAKAYRLSLEEIIADKHLDPNTPPIPLRLLDGAPCVLLRQGNDTRVRADKLCAESNITPNIILELDQLATAYHIACSGMGITFISDTLAKSIRRNQDMVFYKLASPHARRDNFFYYKHSKYVTRPMIEFLSLATQAR